MRTWLSVSALVPFILSGCGSPPSPETPATEPAAPASTTPAPTATVTPEPTPAEAPRAEPDLARGGRLYDKWYADKSYAGTFSPSPGPGQAGKGGPNGDGTLNGSEGVLPNTGHDYRLKNLFGWDLRGKEGVYGPSYQNKDTVLETDLLTDTRPPSELRALFKDGGANVPALGAVLGEGQLDDLVAFVVAMRSHRLPQPGDVWELSAKAPKHYTLKAGGNVEAGRAYFSETCANCHGDTGTEIRIDDEYSLGAFGRAKAYEGWIKVVSGHPGSSMGSQLPEGASVEEQAQTILDVFAALCDRKAFPGLEGEKDVPDGDLRCGTYLK